MVTVGEGGRIALSELLEDGSPAMKLAGDFNDRGHELYVVGGLVRDAGLGREGREVDMATDATPEETLDIVRPNADAVWEQGIKFGTVGARVRGLPVEITTFRSERYQPGSRHPEVEFEATIESDLARRDFTVNAMAIRLPDRKPIDLFGGMEDLKRKTLRTPIDPRESFTDDPLRMLRAFRFASQLDFKIAPEVLETISELKDELKTVSTERIRDELSRMLIGRSPGRGALELADSTGITDLFLPELSSLKLEQDPVHKHKDVFHHTLAVVDRAEPVLEVRLAALLHDIGKPRTRRIESDGVSFHHHEVEGSKMARERLRALKYPNEVVDAVERIIFLHHRFHTYALGWSDSAVRRYVRDAGPLLGKLNALVRADCTTRNAVKAKRLEERMEDLDERIKELASKEELDRIRPDLDGTQIMAFLGVEPGKIVGDAWQFLLDLRLDEGPMTQDEAFARLAAWARERQIEPVGARVPPKEKKKKDE